ncbi:branched-chain amino acid ABC transporter permease [Acrocarpospora catenulata]|uniref:branched-chain amino acid ABC transporter permease n=1 Tax=Acrocarpospora catenulata TaxID=2836182 RepID=UPI002023B413|nr:branched-chain amino acid ABC transporter permease [Acrocarpospora catenulata]
MMLTHSDAPAARTSGASSTETAIGTARVERLVAWGWQPAAIVVWIFVATPLFGGSNVYPLLVLAGIYGIAVVGVSLLAGLGGQMTLGHAVFMAMGAYASALATTKWGLSPLAGMALGIAAALTLALVTSPILRLRGWYLAMATAAFSFLLQQVLVNLRDLTGGNNGIFGIPPLSVGGFEVTGEKSYFIFSWAAVLVLFLLGRNIARSRFGRSLTAIHKDTDAAATVGINPARAKAVLWLVAAVPAAFAGSVFAHYSAFIAPTDFAFATSLLLFLPVLVGGERSIFAGLVMVTVFMTTSAYVTQTLTTELMEAIAVIVICLLSPHGLAGLASTALSRLRAIGRRDA